MPLTQHDLAALEDAIGTGKTAGQSAPNGHNLQHSLNTAVRIAEDMHQYDLCLTDLPAEKLTAYRETVEDLRHHRERLAVLFGEELAGEVDGVAVGDGETVIPFPE